jgi:hypothetical protein
MHRDPFPWQLPPAGKGEVTDSNSTRRISGGYQDLVLIRPRCVSRGDRTRSRSAWWGTGLRLDGIDPEAAIVVGHFA